MPISGNPATDTIFAGSTVFLPQPTTSSHSFAATGRLDTTPPVSTAKAKEVRVLVVDDDEWVRDVLARVLQRHQYQIQTAVNAEEALSILRDGAIDLVISDMLMPGMTGLQLTQAARQSDPFLPIILLTAYSTPELMRRALRQGVTDFVAKPFQIEAIPLIVERSLERQVLERERAAQHNQDVTLSAVEALAAAIDAKEPFTAEHSRRVTQYALRIGEAMHLSRSETHDLELAAQVHDVGKIGTPDHILNKPGPLDAEEWKLIQQHPVQGEEIVTRIPHLAYVGKIIRHHHERIDGKGYPDRLRGEAIPLLSRIVAVADAYDVMTSDRVYRGRTSHEEALHRLTEGAGTQFDPNVVLVMASIPEMRNEPVQQ